MSTHPATFPPARDVHDLERRLGALDLTLIGIGATIGAGIFVLAGTTAAQWSGPAVTLSFFLAALGCLCSALCYAELAALMPEAGSAYSYALRINGRIIGWFIGWNLALEYLVCASTVAVGWSAYCTSFLAQLGLTLPDRYTNAPLSFSDTGHLIATGATFNVPAVILILALTALVLRGIGTTARANNAMVWSKIAIVLLVIACGMAFVHPANWHPFIPVNTSGKFGHFGWSGVLRGAALMFFAYIGFDTVSTLGRETRRPQRDLPIGLLASLATCTALYVAMAAVITGMADYRTLNVANPVYVALAQAGPALAWLQPLVGIGAILGLASAVLSSILGQSRIFYSMARDELLPPLFLRIHPRFATPVAGTLIVGAVSALIAALFPIEVLGELVSMGTLIGFMSVCFNVLLMRRTHPASVREFRVPASPWVPCAGLVCCAILMASLPSATWLRLVVWTALGFILYAFVGRRGARR